MNFHVVYLLATGRILRVGFLGENVKLAETEGVISYSVFTDVSGMAVDPVSRTLIKAGIANAYVIPSTVVDPWLAVRSHRDALLSATDYTMVLDYPVSDADRDKLKAWRQSLRDLTKTYRDPNSVVFPPMPAIG